MCDNTAILLFTIMRIYMQYTLKQLCDFASRHENRHRQPVPGYEASHEMYINRRSDLLFFTSNKLNKRLTDGWEFYISIKNPRQLACAWSEIQSILLDADAGPLGMAVVNIGSLTDEMMEWTYRGGTSIVIYPFVKEFKKTPIIKPRDMCDILCRIETKLLAQNILAGEVSAAAQLVPGSQYISLRNTYHPDLGFMASERALTYTNPSNPLGRKNYYENIRITTDLSASETPIGVRSRSLF